MVCITFLLYSSHLRIVFQYHNTAWYGVRFILQDWKQVHDRNVSLKSFCVIPLCVSDTKTFFPIAHNIISEEINYALSTHAGQPAQIIPHFCLSLS